MYVSHLAHALLLGILPVSSATYALRTPALARNSTALLNPSIESSL